MVRRIEPKGEEPWVGLEEVLAVVVAEVGGKRRKEEARIGFLGSGESVQLPTNSTLAELLSAKQKAMFKKCCERFI